MGVQQISVNDMKQGCRESMESRKSMENILQGVVVCSTGLTSLQKVGEKELVGVSTVGFCVDHRVGGSFCIFEINYEAQDKLVPRKPVYLTESSTRRHKIHGVRKQYLACSVYVHNPCLEPSAVPRSTILQVVCIVCAIGWLFRSLTRHD